MESFDLFSGFIWLLKVCSTSFPVPLIFVSAILIMYKTSSVAECGNQAEILIFQSLKLETYLDYQQHREDNPIVCADRQKSKEVVAQSFACTFCLLAN